MFVTDHPEEVACCFLNVCNESTWIFSDITIKVFLQHFKNLYKVVKFLFKTNNFCKYFSSNTWVFYSAAKHLLQSEIFKIIELDDLPIKLTGRTEVAYELGCRRSCTYVGLK